jgi:hypothetical protein
MERRRLAREGYAFHVMLEAAMGAVIEDVGAARELPPRQQGTYTAEAYAVGQRVKRAGFAELRTAFVRFGERHTSEFLQLDKEIEDFAGRFMTPANPATGFQHFTGVNAGIAEQLDRIEEQASCAAGPPVE